MPRRRSLPRSHFARDAENPKVGEVYETRWGNRWVVTGKTEKKGGRVLVKRAGNRYDGTLEWTPAMLARLKHVRGEEQKAVAAALRPELAGLKFKSGASLLDRVFGVSEKKGEQLSLFTRDPSGRPKRKFYVYVVEQIVRGKRQFYVGQTGKTPKIRFQEHKTGGHYSYAHGAVKLRQDLTKKVNPLYSRKDAERLEKVIARTLRKRGLTVKGGH